MTPFLGLVELCTSYFTCLKEIMAMVSMIQLSRSTDPTHKLKASPMRSGGIGEYNGPTCQKRMPHKREKGLLSCVDCLEVDRQTVEIPRSS